MTPLDPGVSEGSRELVDVREESEAPTDADEAEDEESDEDAEGALVALGTAAWTDPPLH